MLGEDLLRYKENQLYLCPDFESFNLNLMYDNFPWQMAWTIFDNKKIIESHNYYVNWGSKVRMSADAARITGYDRNLVEKQGIAPIEAYKIFNSFLRDKKYLIVGQNWLGFDTELEKNMALELGLDHKFDYFDRLYDTNCIAKAIKKGFLIDKKNLFISQIKLVNFIERGLKTSILTLSKEYGFEIDEFRLHKADYDVIQNAKIFQKQIWQIEI